MENTLPENPGKGVRRKILVWILLLLAGCEFVVRGPMRFVFEPTNWNDLSQNYTASRLWLKGQNPSDPRNFVAVWRREGQSRLDVSDIRTHLAPPLGTLVVMAPIAAFPFGMARLVWLGVLLAAFGATVWTLVLASGVRRDQFRVLVLVAASLALAPFHTGIANGNWTILVVGACVVAVWAAHNHRDVTAGILFALACSLKPQIGGLFVLYYLVRQRWRLFSTAVAGTIGLALVAVLRLEIGGVSWIEDYVHNATGFFTANSIDDFSAANPIRFTLINLQVPFYSITGQSSSANRLAFSVGALLMLGWVYLVIRSRKDASELLPLGAIAVIGLLPVYHRFYDASLLVVALCWCVAQAATEKKIVKMVAVLAAAFLVPGTVVLQQLAREGHIPPSVVSSWWWNCVVMPHESWILLALSLVLLYAMMRDSARGSQSPLVPADESER